MQLPQSKSHNGRLAALFPEVTHEEFCEENYTEYTGGLDQEKINAIVFAFTVGKVRNLPLKVQSGSFKCLVGVAYLPVPASWKEISTIPTDKKLGQLK